MGPAAEPGIRSNDNSRVSRTESCVTDCHDSGRCEGVKGEEGASCAECVCEYECPGGVAGSGLSRGSDDWPAVDKDKGGGSGRDWVRGFAPRGLLLVSIVEDRLRLYHRVGTYSPRLAILRDSSPHGDKSQLAALRQEQSPGQIRQTSPLAPSPR